MNSGVLEISRPPLSVKDLDLHQVIDRFRSVLSSKGAKEAYLFGSFAQGTHGYWSDIDLLVVMETDLPFPDRPQLVWEVMEIGVPVDILVYTPEEFGKLCKINEGFWRLFNESKVRIV